MSDSIVCPDCGQRNPSGGRHCVFCNFPLAAHDAPDAARPEPARPGPVRREPAPQPPRRPRRPPRGMPVEVTNLWLWTGAVVALLIVFAAVNFRQKPPARDVEGASADQQRAAREIAAAIERDSTDVAARVSMGNLLYDTGNWSEAIVHYRAAVARDSSLVTAIVDLGVCYYNLSVPDEAERLFRLALGKDPRQPIALFNMGIVAERRGELERALEFFRAASDAPHPPNMHQPLADAIGRVEQRLRGGGPPSAPRPGSGTTP